MREEMGRFRNSEAEGGLLQGEGTVRMVYRIIQERYDWIL